MIFYNGCWCSTEDGDNFTHNLITCKNGNGRSGIKTYGMKVTVLSVAGPEPLTLEEVKEYLNIDYPDWDTTLTMMITASRQRAEKYMGRSLVPQTLEVSWARTNGYIDLPYSPINQILSAVDKDGNPVEYEENDQGKVKAKNGTVFTYEAGTWDVYPENVRLGLLKDISSFFEYRENVIVGYSLNDITDDARYLYDANSMNLWL